MATEQELCFWIDEMHQVETILRQLGKIDLAERVKNVVIDLRLELYKKGE